MFSDYFSPVAFFIALREVLEGGIIIAVLLGFVEQIIPPSQHTRLRNLSQESLLPRNGDGDDEDAISINHSIAESDTSTTSDVHLRVGSFDRLTRSRNGGGGGVDGDYVVGKMKLQIWAGALLGGIVAAMIGGVFLYVFYTYTKDLWADAELLWEGGFCAVASVLILIMGLAFLRLPHAKTKWRLKLLAVYNPTSNNPHTGGSGKWILFGLPFITVLREGLEGVVFIGGIGLSESGKQVAGGSVVGVVVGCLLAYLLFSSTLPLPLPTFTTISTLLLFLIGSGLAARSAFSFERQSYINAVGQAAAESGNGPGSYPLYGNIWKLDYGDPEVGAEGGGGGWQLAQSLVGWNNVGTYWTVGTYIGYWLVIILTLVKRKYKEGRTTIFGRRSTRGIEREKRRRIEAGEFEDPVEEEEGLLGDTRRAR